MKKLLNWVLPAFLGIVPAWGMEQPGIIEDPFFTSPGTACSIRMVVEAGPAIKALVDATNETQTKSKLVEALCATTGWKMNDPELFGQEQVNAQVICGTQVLEKEHTRAFKTIYKLIGESELKTLGGAEVKETYQPLVGETVTVFKAALYQRPDGTTYKKIGEELYELTCEETRTTGAPFRHCQREWDIISQWKKKTRHQVQTYTRVDVTQELVKLLLKPAERISLSKTTRVELKPAGFEPEVPTCGHGAFPVNAVIIS